ncbi:hypothetical protein DM02DRAFT_654123 [Periconia macrospinosa]|uniref:Cytochrome P450 n=1 Tax=Periconia macrospinosa TaxID=97972 RepID=A0A2V1DX41_9PLEO|nr:hypothetical protein DM02DRAFT_654123 [Periconia macrospinosa]
MNWRGIALSSWAHGDDLKSLYHVSMVEAISSKPYLMAALAGFAMLLLWRLYRFTIVPLIYPNDPKEYPYWIPIIAHLRSFFKNSSQLLDDARRYFKDNRDAYALTVAGQTWYILTSPRDVASVYKINNGSLSYDIFVEEVMGMIGVSKDGVRKAYQQQDGDGKTYKHLVLLCKEYQITQLSPGAKFDNLVNPAIDYILKHTSWSSVIDKRDNSTLQQEKGVTVSLYRFISEIFIGFGQEVYFGKTLSEIEPLMIPDFMTFDKLAWQVLYQYPSFMCGEMLGG